MHIKTTVRYQLTPVASESQKMTNVGENVEVRGPSGTVGRNELVQPLWQAVWRSIKKLNVSVPNHLAIPVLGVDPKKKKSLHPNARCRIVQSTQDTETTQVSAVEEEIKEVQCTQTMEYYSALKNKVILPFATTWMDLQDVMLNERSQTQKGTCCLISCICRVFKKSHTHRNRE